MGEAKGFGSTRGGAGFGLSVLMLASACAGGQSDSVGDLSLSASFTPETTASATAGTDDEGSATTDPTTAETTTGGEAPTTQTPTTGVDPSNPTVTESDAGSSGPPLACIMAADCDDADPCTDDNCINSACSNAPVDCDDGVSCTDDACDPTSGACTNIADDTLCQDADLCNGVETCDATLDCVDGAEVVCNDAQACTTDTCAPATGLCGYEDIVACSGGDGCCPLGCSVAADNDCTCTNLTGAATASSSGGGSDGSGYGPATWIDGDVETDCDGACTECFGWISNDSSPDEDFMQLTWPSEVIIGSMFIDGVAGGSCQASSRAIAGATIQYWSGAAWVNAGSFSNQQGDLDFSFDPPLETTRLRLYDVVTPAGGNNSLAFEWHVYEPLGCTP